MKPKTSLGKWSVGLNVFFLIGVVISISLVSLNILNFEDKWWDITAAIILPISSIAFVLGLIAIKKKDNSILVYLSVILGLLVILFILLHSLFIND